MIKASLTLLFFFLINAICSFAYSTPHAASNLLAHSNPQNVKKVLILATNSPGGSRNTVMPIKALLDGKNNRPSSKIVYIEDALPNLFKESSQQMLKAYKSRDFGELNKLFNKRLSSKKNNDKSNYAAISKMINDYKPDLILSTITAGNKAMQKVAKDSGVPFVVQPTTFDYNHTIKTLLTKDRNTTVLLPLTDVSQELSFGRTKLKTSHASFPVNKDTLNVANKYRSDDPVVLKEIEELKKKYRVKDNDKVIFISMGANGMAENFAQNFLLQINKIGEKTKTLGHDLHVFFVTSANSNLKSKLLNLKTDLSAINLVPFVVKRTDKVDNLTKLGAMSDVIISKPGVNIMSDTMAIGKPLLLLLSDFQYEKINADVVMNLGYAKPLHVKKNKIKQKELSNALITGLFNFQRQKMPAVNKFNDEYIDKLNYIKEILKN